MKTKHPTNHYDTITKADALRLGFNIPVTHILRPLHYHVLDSVIASAGVRGHQYVLVTETKHPDRISVWRRPPPPVKPVVRLRALSAAAAGVNAKKT